MKLDAFVEGDSPNAGTTSSEDPLDCYRRSVERNLGDQLVLLEEETLERFFDHIIGYFNRGLDAEACARTWLRP